MRILFTGGGTGGHFYPIISIAEELNTLIREKRIIGVELFFMSPNPYDAGMLFEQGIGYRENIAGKIRRNPGTLSFVKNFLDLFKIGWGFLTALFELYRLYPDVVFGKGGYASFPALLAARILRIPVMIHESDTIPGKVNLWAGKFAVRIALSYKEASEFFPADKVAYTGHPVRKEIMMPITEGAHEFLNLESGLPTILILGGSQGAEKLNDCILGGIVQLAKKFQIIHQTGKRNFVEVQSTADAILTDSIERSRYKVFDYLKPLALRMAVGASSVIISRAGSTIFEIAAWGTPSIIVPINQSNGDHQRHNAFTYARSGACTVIEEANLTPNILSSEIVRLVSSSELNVKMRQSAKEFFKPNASRIIAEEILKIGLGHEIEK